MSTAIAWLIWGLILAVIAAVLVTVAFGTARAEWRAFREWDEARALERARRVTSPSSPEAHR